MCVTMENSGNWLPSFPDRSLCDRPDYRAHPAAPQVHTTHRDEAHRNFLSAAGAWRRAVRHFPAPMVLPRSLDDRWADCGGPRGAERRGGRPGEPAGRRSPLCRELHGSGERGRPGDGDIANESPAERGERAAGLRRVDSGQGAGAASKMAVCILV